MKNIIKRVLFSLCGLSVSNRVINIYKTLIFNFLAFGVKGIFKTPVYVYNNTKIYRVGTIILHCPMERGIIRIGQLDYKSQGVTKFKNNGTIELWGPIKIEGATIVENDGLIEFHGFNRIADGCLIVVREKLVLGEQSRIGFQSFIMDSDDHYTVDVITKEVHRNKKEIIIGNYNWIASRSVIKKGVRTPDYLIVASANALLVKDYSELPPYSVIGGSPVKLIKTGVRRVYEKKNEEQIDNFFKDMENSTFFVEEDLDSFCSQKTSEDI
ncbi:MAG: hypothetical protein MJ198_08090 [Bacteroidales bacterium]|nr:hypothetical protein [Bacteroidales bacterium]